MSGKFSYVITVRNDTSSLGYKSKYELDSFLEIDEIKLNNINILEILRDFPAPRCEISDYLDAFPNETPIIRAFCFIKMRAAANMTDIYLFHNSDQLDREFFRTQIEMVNLKYEDSVNLFKGAKI